MDIAFLLNRSEDNDCPTSHQPQFEAGRDALEQSYHSGYPLCRPSPGIYPMAYMRSLNPPSPDWNGATPSRHALGISHRTAMTNSTCRVHSRSRSRRTSFRPVDDATILYLSEAIQGSPRTAMQLALRCGMIAIDARRDALYGYQPDRNCLACRSVCAKLVKTEWQYQDVSWNSIETNSDLKAVLVIPPPRRVRLRDTFSLPLVLRAPRDTLDVSANLEHCGLMTPLQLKTTTFRKETFFLVEPPTLTILGSWRVLIYIQRETGASVFNFDISCEQLGLVPAKTICP